MTLNVIERAGSAIRTKVARLYIRVDGWARREAQRADMQALGACGAGSSIGPAAVFLGPQNIFMKSAVSIGYGAHLSVVGAPIFIGNHVMLAPKVAIITGNHNTGVVGRVMTEVHEKRPTDDQAVVIEDDVWIGFGAILLKGARIGRGSVVGAGAVVTRAVPPYSVVAGNPGRVLFPRFTEDVIVRHEAIINGEGADSAGTEEDSCPGEREASQRRRHLQPEGEE